MRNAYHQPDIDGSEPDEGSDEYDCCDICGGPIEWVDCYACFGEGEFDLYEQNPLEYEPGEIERCDVCHGKGGYLECMHLEDHPQNRIPSSISV